MQLNVKKHIVYGAIAFIWIVFPALDAVFGIVATDIIGGTCRPFAANPSYVAGMVAGFFNLFIDYLLPMPLLVFCYARIVHALRKKVSFCHLQFVSFYFITCFFSIACHALRYGVIKNYVIIYTTYFVF